MEYKYIDTHSHIYFDEYKEDLDEVLTRMREEETGTIVIGTKIDTSTDAVAFAKAHSDVVLGATIGLHPNSADEGFDPEAYEPLLKEGVVLGVGECGLDFFRSNPLEIFEKQQEVFEAQVDFALQHDLPLMLHVRPSAGSDDAHEEALKVLETKKGVRGNCHFFTGSLAMAERYWDLGFTTAFPGVITFAKELEEVVEKAPLDLILGETDSPYATPVPFRGERNEPVRVKEVYKKIAEIKNLDAEEVREVLTQNAERVFGR
ncbi:TatD family hydrolase [Candidatus Kaiserbacteria bacterium]|nr:TatD family hydrolase [Candidatus Kaiserbacteria bacterium]